MTNNPKDYRYLDTISGLCPRQPDNRLFGMEAVALADCPSKVAMCLLIFWRCLLIRSGVAKEAYFNAYVMWTMGSAPLWICRGMLT